MSIPLFDSDSDDMMSLDGFSIDMCCLDNVFDKDFSWLFESSDEEEKTPVKVSLFFSLTQNTFANIVF